MIVAAVCIVISASYRLYDTDLWSLLVVGKAMWTLRSIPHVDLWTWRHYGDPMVISSWIFRAMLWPIWSSAGVAGLYAWRWIAVLAAFALLLATARAMGAKGMSALFVMAWAGLVYRLRTDVRPETLAAILFALDLWILETSARGASKRVWWMVPIACVWANAHISWYLGFILLGAMTIDALLAAARGDASGRARSRRLALVAGASIVASFLNPFGVRLLAQPFEFAFSWRHDPMFQAIGELQPLVWSANLKNGLPIMMAGWPLLMLWRARRRGIDVAEIALGLFFTAVALGSQRFVATYALVAAPFLARDLDAFLGARRWRVAHAGAWTRAAACAALSVAISIPEWTRVELPLGIGIEPASVPSRACDFIAAQGIRGRAFNESHLGGYLAYRFWPDRERLPWIGTQPEYASSKDRALYIAAYSDSNAWHELDGRYRFDYLVLERDQSSGSQLLDFLDLDRSWVMVFTDDAAEVLVRSEGPFAPVARRFGYGALPAGIVEREQLLPACAASGERRARTIAELKRAAASSPLNGSVHHLLGVLALMEDRFPDARVSLERAIRLKPLLPRVHELLGMIALHDGRPREAVAEFALERRLHHPERGLDLRFGQAYARLGEIGRARDSYRRELERDPQNGEARDSLSALDRR
jgi:hypothetical protein